MSYTQVISMPYGQLVVPINDGNQVKATIRDGQFLDHNMVVFLSNLIKDIPNPVVVDGGCNVGNVAFGISKYTNATIHAIEAQRIIFNMVCGSVALNCKENIYVYNNGLSDNNTEMIDVPMYDYNIDSSFGSVELGKSASHHEVGQMPKGFEQVRSMTIDSLNLPKVDLIKLDVEGMEEKALDGARETIARCRPLLFVEFIKSDRANLERLFTEMGYRWEVSLTLGDFICYPI